MSTRRSRDSLGETYEKLRESEVKRKLEFELYEKVSEELKSGKRIWNSAWLDSQEKSGVARSTLAENQISGACQCDDVFAGKRKIMRKDDTTRKLLKVVHGTQVASLRWQRLARGTLSEDQWKVPISVPCVGYNETKDSLVVLHGDVTTILSTTAGEREQTETFAVHFDAVGSRMVQRLGARKHCNVELK